MKAGKPVDVSVLVVNWNTCDLLRDCLRSEIIHIGGASAAKLGAQRAKIKNRSFVRYIFKHWSKPRAVIGLLAIGFFYAIRLVILVPKQLFHSSFHDEKLIENHWAGLKDLMTYRRHLAS
jgi:GT2 family glycosyltransferase